MPKPKLTRAEKAALKLEKKRLKLEAAKEKKKQIIRDYLSRELQYGLLSNKKIELKWKQILRNYKLKDLGVEFQIAVTHAERLLDTKDFVISLLMDELDEAHKQYDMNFGSHCARLDDLFQGYLMQLQDMRVKYDEGIKFLKDGLNEEINDLNTYSKDENEYLSELEFGNEKISNKQAYEVTVNRLKYVEEMKHKYIEDQDASENIFEKKFINFWNSYKNTVQSFQNEAQAKKKQYDEFAEHNRECTKIIKYNRDKLFQQYVYMKREKDHQELEQDKFQQKIEFHNDEFRKFRIVLNDIKKLLDRDEKSDRKQLLFLVKQTENTTKKLHEKKGAVEKILKMYSSVRKYETEKEKILPFPKMTPEHLPKGFRVQSNRNMIGDFALDLKEFINFWQRVARSDKTRNFLNEEMLVLLSENKKIRQSILECLHADPNKLLRIQGINMKLICK